MSRSVPSLLLGSLLCVSCEGGAIEPSQSLVGAERLPSAKALAREILYIARGGGPDGGDALSYEWHPDDLLTVTHTFSDEGGAGEIVKGKDILRLAPDVAAEARRLLWRVRPASLEGVGQDARPAGCRRRGPHDFGEVIVGFIDKGDEADTGDDRVGIFQLPTRESCNTPAAIEARKVVWRALQLFPRSRAAMRYDRSG
jgi:hypothetical protein